MIFSHNEFDSHERVIFIRDAVSNLTAIIALHSMVLGPAFGGCRLYPYACEEDALRDVLRLSRGMTYKAAICDLPYGGGKTVIIGNPETDKTPALLRAIGRAVEALQGAYIIADDVGVTLSDLAIIGAETRYTAATTEASQAPLPVTAYGVLSAIAASVTTHLNRTTLEGIRVCVQGLGAVGMPLCGFLHERGAQLIVSDTDQTRMAQARTIFNAQPVEAEDIYDMACDIFCPCAFGAVINNETLPRFKTRIICGGANNQLADKAHDRALHARGIIYIPDYLAGAGGVIDFYQESRDDRPESVLQSVERIGAIAHKIITESVTRGQTVLERADAVVRERLKTER